MSCSKANKKEGTQSCFGQLLFFLYGLFKRGFIRRLIRKIILKVERDGHYSVTIRRIFSTYHNVEIGMYSRGAIFCKDLPPGTRIGRYCSIFPTMRIFSGNHPMNTKSTHAFFYNPKLDVVETDIIERTKLTIGNDVWIGHNAIILSSVSSVGDGAVIGAGAVVHQDVPPYAVVVGNPARTVRYRFSEQTIQVLLESKWWNKSVEELRLEMDGFREPLEGVQKVR